MKSDAREELTVDRWRLEPRLHVTEPWEPGSPEQAPPLWKDVALAWFVAVALWGSAALLFR